MIELPKEKVKAESKSANRILMYAKPKQGKTTALSLLEDSLIIDTESGSDFVDAYKVKIDITKPIEQQAAEFKEVCKTIYMAGYDTKTKVYTPKYKCIIIDTYTRLDDWAEIVGTLNFMEKAQGKSWNRVKDGPSKGQVISSSDPNFESVHEMGQGFGYKHSREVMLDWYNKICMLSPKTIFVCHVKDKLVSVGLNEQVSTREINLTGKVKDIIASKVDTIMYCYREGNKLLASFSGDDGTRCSYLSGKVITLTESNEEGEIITNNWKQIFID
jgi:hypothetical protein